MSEHKNLLHSEPIPIFRSFESEGKKYVYGYAALFNTPDNLGTTMTKACVEANIPRLRKFPAVRFMHRIAFGQILFDETIEGQKTVINSTGFHVLVRVYDSAEKEFSMVVSGKWGLSYGFLPDKNGGIQNGAFIKGILYEISVVDSPAHEDAVAHVIRRAMNGHFNRTGETVKLTMEGFTVIQLHEDGTRSFFKPPENKVKVAEPLNEAQLALRALEDEHRIKIFPETCSKECTNVQCPYRRQENFGKPCLSRLQQYKTEPSWLETRSLNPNNLPDYRAIQISKEITKPKKEMKTSLNPS